MALGLWLTPPFVILHTPAAGALDSAMRPTTAAPDTDPLNEELT
ncbi:hypothetical protein [Streptomyces luteolus]|uniref:Uncharacterized protein n=1 Tax=Streptomyces luteolus TaxID=3043615 RepID=A0ABT6SXS2_9ACTN|nr:hypothetical protein [Streptomyces sp. B-S-A12]MDI3420394.1 hypothetical protein [Streptomyces sp. B-S-A12]